MLLEIFDLYFRLPTDYKLTEIALKDNESFTPIVNAKAIAPTYTMTPTTKPP
jgi:hypothetical protein